jgi:hypothetical protein
MTKQELNDKKIIDIAIQRLCAVCKKPLTLDNAQYAHRIPKHKKYIKKYGKEVINSRFNLALVCSLKCNCAVLLDPATHPVEAAELIKQIKEERK